MTTFVSGVKQGVALTGCNTTGRRVLPTVAWWLSGRALDLRFTRRGFNSRPVAFT